MQVRDRQWQQPLGRTSQKHMERIDDSIRVSLHLDPEDPIPIPESVEFP